jgi:Ca2+-binding RTX toxin-like protein
MPFNTSVIDITQGAEVIIGGAGSDIIRGNLGNDIIDGDAWLNVRISVLNAVPTEANPNPGEWFTVDSVNELKARMLSGEINPGQLKIVREIITGPADASIDTAVFSDLFENYDLTQNVDGSMSVAHVGGTAIDGTDRLRNIEQIQFSDALVAFNRAPTGAPAINFTRLTEGAILLASIGTLVDLDGLPLGGITYQWQEGDGIVFNSIDGATDATFTPTQAQVGLQLRVVAVYTDNRGFEEQVLSAPTDVVGDLIIGNGFANTLTGTIGQDRIEARAGHDFLFGLEANDILIGEDGNDNINGGTGNDQLEGGAGFDFLDGGTGDDIMSGGTENDVYVVDSIGDQVIELAGQGTDTVRTDLSSYTLAANVENLVATGSADAVLNGNGLANVITSGAGNDTLSGGAGNDTYVINNAGDTVVELAGEGSDLVRTDLASFTLSDFVENLMYTGSGDFTGTGNGTSNTLWGGVGNDTLFAGASADRLLGGAGHDFMDGGDGNDTFVFAALFGQDTIQGFDANPVGGQDRLDLSALGITAVTFGTSVVITDAGPDTLIQIDGNSITLLGIDDATTVNAGDFILAA